MSTAIFGVATGSSAGSDDADTFTNSSPLSSPASSSALAVVLSPAKTIVPAGYVLPDDVNCAVASWAAIPSASSPFSVRTAVAESSSRIRRSDECFVLSAPPSRWFGR